MKILILLAYYNRPKMVRLPLESIRNQSYKNWHLAFVDDGSDIIGRPIVEEILADDLDKVTFYNTGTSRYEKELMGGSIFGSYWNLAMKNSDADIAIMLCDDDALYDDYLEKLAEYYTNNPDVIYSYGHLSVFNPLEHLSLDTVTTNTNFHLNLEGDICPVSSVDASQVSWRLPEINARGIEFPYPQTINLDESFYRILFDQLGACKFNGLITQYKGWHTDQMGNRKEIPYNVKDK